MPRTSHAFLLSGLVLLAGCSGLPQLGLNDETTTSTTVSPRVTATTTPTTTPTVPPPDIGTTRAEFEVGDNLLSLQGIDESNAFDYNQSERADFNELSPSQQSAFLYSYDCDCSIQQAAFKFNDTNRIKVVRYEGDWYYLNVAIV